MGISPNNLLSTISDDITHSQAGFTNVQSYMADSLLRGFLKKFEENSDITRGNAIRNFIEVNNSVSLNFSLPERDDICRVITHARDLFLKWFPQTTFYEPSSENGRFGPGASHGTKGTDIVSKYSGNIGYCTSTALGFYLRALGSNPYLYAAESKRRRRLGYSKIEVSKLTTVPKNDSTDRTICIEPSLQMYLQQAIRTDLEIILAREGLNISSQPTRQKRMALEGSINDSFSTIDLSNASDTIGLSFCRYLLPPDLLWWLLEARTPAVEVDGEIHRLNMLSTMGNATTFPIQTLIFYSLLRGVYLELGHKVYTRRSGASRLPNCGVFGDDIIVIPEAYDLMVATLHACGFSVNLEKSFKNGLFKESCGGDYYAGWNVRPVYLRNLGNVQDLNSIYNRLHRWSTKSGIPLRKTLATIYRAIKKPLFVPLWEQDYAGIQVSRHPPGYYECYVASNSYVDLEGVDPLLFSCLCFGGIMRGTVDGPKLSRRSDRVRYRKRRRYALSFTGSKKPIRLDELVNMRIRRETHRSGPDENLVSVDPCHSYEWTEVFAQGEVIAQS